MKIKNEKMGVISVIPYCIVCFMDFENRDEAKQHTKDTGHETRIETTSIEKFTKE
jgi:hypothetical protein